MTVTKSLNAEALQPEQWDLSELLPEPSEAVISSRISDLEASVGAIRELA